MPQRYKLSNAMEFALLKHLELFLLPPGGLILLGVIGLLVLRHSSLWGTVIISSTFALFYLISTP